MSEAGLLEALHVKHQINGKLILDDVSLSLYKGKVTGLLGQNGAGKTTLLNIMSGCVEPLTGSVLVNGKSVFKHPELKRNMGYLPDQPALQDTFSVSEQLGYAAALFKNPTNQNSGRLSIKTLVDYAIERCDLGNLKNRLNGQLSKGQRQRVGIAQSIMHHPEILILDEPTEGLDPIQIQFLRNLIIELREDCAIILSSHFIAEVDKVCDDVLVLQQGRISLHLSQRQGSGKTSKMIKLGFEHDIDEAQLKQCAAITDVTSLELSTYLLETLNPAAASKQIIELCHKNQWTLLEMKSGYSDLEEHFFNLDKGINKSRQNED